ncbi:hypothetical protein H6G54_18135 [Anabaena cylindrica FACHB-243]|nr:hypothetical protein [Anabaena cylindrica FACHB-243]MBY5282846.1 hypothetical protein [Anabaena sp. CCAP 1446/1C]MBY5306930.1 hypothetical protein [Anabaena sp. CCAP 1446/1C]
MISDQNFQQIKESASIDKRGRLTLGAEATSKQYRVMKNKSGQILLDPVVNIPERELWLWKNPEATDSLKKGMQEAAAGELHDLGSFAEYADLEIDD